MRSANSLRLPVTAGGGSICLGLLLALGASPLLAAETIRIGGAAWIADAPTKVADLAGLFDTHRSAASPESIQVLHFDSGREAMTALLAGEINFALGAAPVVARALLIQAQAAEAATPAFVILASLAIAPHAHYLVADRERGIRTPADLAGRRIGVLHLASSHFAWTRFARLHDIPEDSVELIDVRILELAEVLADGRVDAVMAWNPWGDRMLRDLGERGIAFPTRDTYSATWLLVGNTDLVTQRPALAERVLKAYRDAIDLLERDPARARILHARALGVEVAELARLERDVIWNLELGWPVLSGLQAAFDWLSGQAAFAGRPPPPLAPFIEARPLSRVAPDSITLPPYLYRDSSR